MSQTLLSDRVMHLTANKAHTLIQKHSGYTHMCVWELRQTNSHAHTPAALYRQVGEKKHTH